VLASYTSDTVEALSTFSVLPNVVAPAYWLVNLRAGVRTTDDKYELAVFANNLFDQAYYTVGNSSALGNVLNWGEPRVVGVELRARLF
jgi:outer membrane receptor protein involved in Fe transport